MEKIKKYQNRIRVVGVSLAAFIVVSLLAVYPLAKFLYEKSGQFPRVISSRIQTDIYPLEEFQNTTFESLLWPLGILLFFAISGVVLSLLPPKDFESIFKHRLNVLLWTILSIGVLFRVRAYLVGRSFWLDEVLLAQNLRRNDTYELLSGPLENAQTVPAGFWWFEVGISKLFGTNEFILRMFPFIAGSLLLFVTLKISKIVFDRSIPKILLLASVSFSPVLIYYSQEFKQYSVDTFFSSLLLFAIIRAQQTNRKLLLALVGAIGALFSHTALLLLIPLGFVTVIDGFKNQSGQPHVKILNTLRENLGVYLTWSIGILLQGIYVLRSASGQQGLLHDWWQSNGGFPVWGDLVSTASWYITSLTKLGWLGVGVPGRSGPDMGAGLGITAFAIFLLGVYAAYKKAKYIAFPMLSVLTFVLLAQFHLYPFSSRLIIFLIPIVFFIAVSGVEKLLDSKTKLKLGLAGIATITILAPQLITSSLLFSKPNDNWDMIWALQEVTARSLPGDVLLSPDEIIVDWYVEGQSVGNARFQSIEVLSAKNLSAETIREELLRSTRIWIVSTHAGTGEIEEGIGDRFTLVCSTNIDDSRVGLFVRNDLERSQPQDICGIKTKK